MIEGEVLEFEIGTRVEVDKDEDGWNWNGGFICRIHSDEYFEIKLDYIRENSRRKFHRKYIRLRELDQEGFLLAVENGFTDVAKRCIENGYDVNSQDPYFNTILHKSCSAGNLELVKYLIEEKNARTDLLNMDGELAFDQAFSHGKMNVIKYFLGFSKGHNRCTLMTGFLQTFQKHIPEIGLRNINLIRVKDFLQWDFFLKYDECVSLNLHQTADKVSLEFSEILFISHRWDAEENPDPKGQTCCLCKDFLQSTERHFDYVFVDWSCVCQDKSNPDFYKHVKNIPTVIFLSTGCLVVPRTYQLGSTVPDQYKGKKISDIRDFLSRGWCKIETVMSMIAGSQVFCCYLLEDSFKKFIEIPGYSCYTSETGVLEYGEYYHGFQLAGTLAMEQIPMTSTQDKQNLWESLLMNWWGVPMPEDPTAFLAIVVHTLLNLSRDMEMGEKIFKMQITEEDVQEIVLAIPLGSVKLQEISKMMGYLTAEEDRLQLLRMIMFFLMYCADKVPLHFSNDNNFDQELPSPILQVSLEMNINIQDLLKKGDAINPKETIEGPTLCDGQPERDEQRENVQAQSKIESQILCEGEEHFPSSRGPLKSEDLLQSHICQLM